MVRTLVHKRFPPQLDWTGFFLRECLWLQMSGRCFEDVMEHVRTPERPLHIQFAEEVPIHVHVHGWGQEDGRALPEAVSDPDPGVVQARTTAVGFADVPTVDAALVVPVGGGPVVEVAAVVEVAVVAVPPQP